MSQNNDNEKAKSVNDSVHLVNQSASASASSRLITHWIKRTNINPENVNSDILENMESERIINFDEVNLRTYAIRTSSKFSRSIFAD